MARSSFLRRQPLLDDYVLQSLWVLGDAVGILTPSENLSVNQSQLVDAVAATSGYSKTDAAKVIDALSNAITAALKNGDDVRIAGFGTFSIASREAPEGRNPKTGEPLSIAASKVAKFSTAKALKDSLNH